MNWSSSTGPPHNGQRIGSALARDEGLLYDVFRTIRPLPLETAKIVQEGWATSIVTVLGDSQSGGFSKIMRGSLRTMKRKVTSILFFN